MVEKGGAVYSPAVLRLGDQPLNRWHVGGIEVDGRVVGEVELAALAGGVEAAAMRSLRGADVNLLSMSRRELRPAARAGASAPSAGAGRWRPR